MTVGGEASTCTMKRARPTLLAARSTESNRLALLTAPKCPARSTTPRDYTLLRSTSAFGFFHCRLAGCFGGGDRLANQRVDATVVERRPVKRSDRRVAHDRRGCCGLVVIGVPFVKVEVPL